MKEIVKAKILFLGTPKFASIILEELIANGYEIVCVLTQPDKRVGRRHRVTQSIVKKIALNNNIKVLQPWKINDIYEDIKELDFNIIITAAYGQIISNRILELSKLGSFNLHGSLLPKYRGGAPIHRAIMNGEEETGISLMFMAEKMDAGDYIKQYKVKIGKEETLTELYARMSIVAAQLIIDYLPKILSNNYTRIKQDPKEVTFGKNITSKDEYVDFKWTNSKVINHIRGLDSVPGAYVRYGKEKYKIFDVTNETTLIDKTSKPGTIIKIDQIGLFVKTKDGIINIRQIQREGKKKMEIKDFINGNTLLVEGGIFNGE